MSEYINTSLQPPSGARMAWDEMIANEESSLAPRMRSTAGTAIPENESIEPWILNAARELAMDSAHIPCIAQIIKHHAPCRTMKADPQPNKTCEPRKRNCQRHRLLASASCYAVATELLDTLIKDATENARIRKRHVRQRIAGMEPWPVRGPSKQAAHLWQFYLNAVESHKNATRKVWILRRICEAA